MRLDNGPDQQRKKSVFSFQGKNGEGQILKTKFFSSGPYEEEVTLEGTRHLHYVSGGDGLAAVVDYDGESKRIYYILKDHLGSWYAVTDETGHVVSHKGTEQRYSFDPWGRRRNATTWSYDNTTSEFLFDRGFTGHEHLDDVGLINMNGRAYDPMLARFLSPDPVVQSPFNPQNYNRYSYCLNNPLRYSDPTGYLVQEELDYYISCLLDSDLGGTWSSSGGLEFFCNESQALETMANYYNDNIANHTEPGLEGGVRVSYGIKVTFKVSDKILPPRGNSLTSPRMQQSLQGVSIHGEWRITELSSESNTLIPMPGNPAATRNPMPGGAASNGYAMETVYTIANTLNEFNPIAQIWDVVTYAFTGTDRFGHNISLGQGMLKAATMLPIGKIGSLVGKASGTELFNFSATAAGHMSNPSRTVPVQILEQALMSSKGVPDPRGSRALLYKTEMWKNGELHNLEILYDHATNSIWHFKYFKP